ncbi:MAG: tetratricopeptide repeat protein [Chitinophagales bacterium]
MSEDAIFNKIIEYISTKEYSKALGLLNKGIEKAPNDHRLYDLRGTIFHRSGKPEEALADYEAAIQLQKNNFSLHYGRGMAYLKLKAYESALADFEVAAQLNPQYVEAIQKRDQLRNKLGIVIEEVTETNGTEKKGCLGMLLLISFGFVLKLKIGLLIIKSVWG